MLVLAPSTLYRTENVVEVVVIVPPFPSVPHRSTKVGKEESDALLCMGAKGWDGTDPY